MQSAIRTDGGQTGTLITENLLYKCTSQGILLKFIDELPPGPGDLAEDRRGRKLARVKDADTDYNIYFCKANPEKGKSLLRKNQADGVDKNSRSEDPLFEDPENGDFRFKPHSPALDMGIVPIDISKAGLQK